MERPLKQILGELRSLEPFPRTALRVLELSLDEDLVPNDLVAIIQADPGLTAKVLKLCNSAYYGFQRQIASLREAGNALGSDTLVNLVLTTCTNRYFRNLGSAEAGEQERRWQSCITNAFASRLLAQVNQRVDSERAYTVGLLQNLGHVVLDRFLEEAREDIRSEVAAGCSVLDAERIVLGLTHAEIGARLATHWGLPDVLVDTIRFHHAPHHANVDQALAATAHLAETLSWAVGAADGIEDLPYDVCAAALELAHTDAKRFALLPDRLRADLKRAKELLDVEALAGSEHGVDEGN
jgi:HD-like signal output (HDOD) protein